jgi:peptidyl-prolyl cis-trans isomerase C
MKTRVFEIPLTLMLAVALTGCPPKGGTKVQESGAASASGQKASEKKGETLATVGDLTITTEDFRKRLMRQSPLLRARYNTVERKKQFLDNMVRFELLAREARRRGLDQDPDVQETLKKVMVQKLIRQLNEGKGEPIPEEKLREFYQSHIDNYVKPERVRIAQIFVRVDDPKKAAQAKKRVQAILAEVKKRASEPTGFQLIAREKSDDASTRDRGGDLGYHTREELSSLWGDALAEAAFGLEKVGDVSAIVHTDKGFHILKLTGKQKALNRTFDQVRLQIEGMVRREERTKLFNDFVEGLKKKEGVTINDALLETIDVSASGVGPGGRPGGPRKIFPPPGKPAMPMHRVVPQPGSAPKPGMPGPQGQAPHGPATKGTSAPAGQAGH